MAKVVGVVPSRSDRILPKLRVLLVASAGLALLTSFADPAGAAQRRSQSLSSYFYGYSGYRGYNGYTQSTSRGSRQAVSTNRAEPKKDPGFGELPKGPLQIIVSIGSQKVTLYANGQRVAQGPVSTGQPGHSTPMGVFSVIEKDRYHHSNIYSGAPMPFMQRITWSGVALHEGALPGYPASHGCIRMSHDFAQKLWPVTKLGVRVVVARGDLSPVDFEHPKLFAPRPKPDGSQVAQADEPIRLAQVKTATEEGVTVVDVTPVPALEEATPAEPAKPVEAPRATEAPAEPAVVPADPVRATDNSTDDVKETGAVELRKSVEAPKPAEEPKSVDAVQAPAEAAPKPADVAPKAVEMPKPAEAVPASTEPAKPSPDLVDPPKPAAPRIKAADQPQKRNGQIAVFVSRKEKKIFVRQGFQPLFDMPITIDQPEHPLGTHVFTAMGVTEDGSGMRWNLITVPTDASHGVEPVREGRRRGRVEAPVVHVPVSGRAPSSAAEALDRIHFPQEAIDRISDLLIPGSSLVVSDEGLGRETGRGTEFIVLTR